MNAAPEIKGDPEIKGWCPGALRPMASGDGLLIRAKVVGCVISTQQVCEIAAIARDCGNGLIDLSQRAQLQLRGLRDAALPEALRRLAAVSLLAPDARSESVMNVLVPPAAGLGATAPFDANALALDLARAVASDISLRRLPGKFLFIVDDASALGLANCDADIRIEAMASESGSPVALVVAGARDQAVVVDLIDAIDAALKLARAFLKLREGRAFELRRMASLTAALGAAAVFREAGLRPAPYRSACKSTSLGDIFGAHGLDDLCFVGVGAPFGRWRADDLAGFAALAARHGVGALRLTPWRAFLAPTPSPDIARAIARGAAKLGLISCADDPRLAIVACSGAPECPQARGATRAHLDRLAPLAKSLARDDGLGLHVSGCAKGCAHPTEAPIVLLAQGDAFDLIDNGRAADSPFIRGLSLDDVARELTARAALRRDGPCRAP